MPRKDNRVDLVALSGRRVLNRRGEPLGRICELFLDMEQGRVEYATLQLQMNAPHATHRLIIPWSQFMISSDREHLELGISKTVLEAVARHQF